MEGLYPQRYYTTVVWGTAQGTLGDRDGAIILSLLKEPLVAFSSSFYLPLLAFFCRFLGFSGVQRVFSSFFI
jgi:hypothetical protein